MTSSIRHVCTLCNQEFDAPSAENPRCPHCLRRVGVVEVPTETPHVRRRFLPRLSGRTWLALSLSVALVGVGIACWQFLPDWLSGTTGSEAPLASFCSTKRVVCPAPDTLTLPPELAAAPTGGELAKRLGPVLKEHGSILRPDAPPGGLRSAAEILEGRELQIIPLEAVAVAWGAAQAAQLELAPCLPEPQLAAEPFWQRGYALCDDRCNLVYSPLPPPSAESRWQCLTAPRFTAHFIAASGELSRRPKKTYWLFSVARELHDEPDMLLHLGVAKVRNNAAEFGIVDMRTALQSGAAADGQLLLGDALLATGLPADALGAYESLLQVAPESTAGLLGKARTLGLLRRGEEAAAILKKLEEEDPDLPGLWAAVALMRRQSDDLPGAIAALRQEVARNPTREHVASLVDLLLEESKAEEAMTLLDTLYEELHRADLALMALQLAGATGRENEAQERLTAALAAHPDDVELLGLAAQRALDASDSGGAEKLFMRLRERDPENPQVLVDLALARFALEKAGDHGARPARETVDELGKKWPRRVYQVAQTLSSWKYWDETEKLLEERLAQQPGNRRLTAWLYFFYLSHEKAEKAAQLRERKHPDFDEEDLEWLGEAFQRIDRRVAKDRQEQDK